MGRRREVISPLGGASSGRGASLAGSRGALVGSAEGAAPLCPPEAVSSRHCLKEGVSKRGQRAVCPLTNPRGLQSERCGWRSPQRWSHKADARCLPRFLMEAPPAARG